MLSNGGKSLISPNSGNCIANSKGEHYAIENESLYILINKNSCSDCDDLAKRITVAVKKIFSRH